MQRSTNDIERALVESALAGGDLAASLDQFVGHLLSTVPGYGSRATDGVLLQITRVSDGRVFATGVVVMIDDQTVEPLRIEVVLDSSGGISEGHVYFGDRASTARYGSREHRKMERSLAAEPPAEYSWKQCFRRDDDGWHPN